MTVPYFMESNMSEAKKKKIMVQIWDQSFAAMNREFALLHLKRDSYWNTLLSSEIERLDSEVTFRNSDAVRARFNERKLPNRKKLTIELDARLVARIDEVLDAKNIARDAFMNRVLFFLLSRKPLLDELGIQYKDRSEAVANSLEGARSMLTDPFSPIRTANDGRFYTLACFPDGPFQLKGPNLFALNTVIDEQAWQAMNYGSDNFFAKLGAYTDEEISMQTKALPLLSEEIPASKTSMADAYTRTRQRQ
jgi:hypothetical protein